jgi:hypothetical protein
MQTNYYEKCETKEVYKSRPLTNCAFVVLNYVFRVAAYEEFQGTARRFKKESQVWLLAMVQGFRRMKKRDLVGMDDRKKLKLKLT